MDRRSSGEEETKEWRRKRAFRPAPISYTGRNQPVRQIYAVSESTNSWSRGGERKCNRSDDVESEDKFGRFVCRRSHHASRDSSRARKRLSSRQMCKIDRALRGDHFYSFPDMVERNQRTNFSPLRLC